MSDYSTIQLDYNTGTDASPTWTGTAIAFGGSSGANELRFANSGGGSSIGSASWPLMTRPGSTQSVAQLWAFTADTTGSQVATYTGDNTKANVLRWDFDANGTLAAAFQFSMFGDNTHATPSPGTQPGAQSGSPIVNGQSSDTSSFSYTKINAYGFGVNASGTQQTPAAGSVGTNPTATTNNAAGSVSTSSAAWLSTWQDAQGWTDYILDGAICKALTAGFWYWHTILFTGPGMSTGTLKPVYTLQYSYS